MSTIHLEVWQLITMLIGFLSAIASVGWAMIGQIDKRLESRFTSMEQSRAQSTAHWDGKFRELSEDQQKGSEAWRSLERDFLKFRGDLPLEYVRREDFIRNQSVIEAKLDAVALHIQNMQLQRNNKNG